MLLVRLCDDDRFGGGAWLWRSGGSGYIRNQVKGFRVQRRVGRRDHATAVARLAAIPCGHDTAGLLDDRDQGDDVVGLKMSLDYEINEAGR